MTILQDLGTSVHRKHFTRAEYHFLADSGLLGDARYELLGGDILAQMPQKEPHGSLIMSLVFLMARIFGDTYIRCQMPIVLSNDGEPEPDIAVTRQERSVYQSGTTPTSADIQLIVEVSVSTFDYDTGEKSLRYAQSGIGEYWVVDVERKRLFVFHNPSSTGYGQPTILGESDTVSPLAAPSAIIFVKELLP